METSPLSINSAYGYGVGRDLYRATPAVTCDFASNGRILRITQLGFFFSDKQGKD